MAAKAIREIGSGDTLIVMADDDAFEADIQAWCKKTGNELIALSRRPDYVEAEVKRG
jgi:TusA-related sulfurtransferase